MVTLAKDKLRSHQLDIYGTWLHLATTRKAWNRLRRTRIDSLPEIPDDALGLTTRDIGEDGDPDGAGAVHISIYLDASRLSASPTGLIEITAHEAVHAAGMLLDHIGQEYDGESEALGYLVGYIAAWCWEGCAR